MASPEALDILKTPGSQGYQEVPLHLEGEARGVDVNHRSGDVYVGVGGLLLEKAMGQVRSPSGSRMCAWASAHGLEIT